MKKTVDPLETLIVNDNEPVNRKKLADLIAPYIEIGCDGEEGEIICKEEFYELGNKERISVYMAARKALFELQMCSREGLSMSELIEVDLMPEGSTKGTISTLNGTILSSKIADSVTYYYLPPYRVDDVREMLSIDTK